MIRRKKKFDNFLLITIAIFICMHTKTFGIQITGCSCDLIFCKRVSTCQRYISVILFALYIENIFYSLILLLLLNITEILKWEGGGSSVYFQQRGISRMIVSGLDSARLLKLSISYNLHFQFLLLIEDQNKKSLKKIYSRKQKLFNNCGFFFFCIQFVLPQINL